MINLIGQVALITGGSRGIGAATAIMFAKAGADVAITYHKDKEAADSVVKEVKKIGRKAIAINGNVENAKDAKNIVSQTFIKNFGKTKFWIISFLYPVVASGFVIGLGYLFGKIKYSNPENMETLILFKQIIVFGQKEMISL